MGSNAGRTCLHTAFSELSGLSLNDLIGILKPGGRMARPGGRFPNRWLVLNLRQSFCDRAPVNTQSPRYRPIRSSRRRKCLYCLCLCH